VYSNLQKPKLFHATQTVTECSGTSRQLGQGTPLQARRDPLVYRISRKSAHEGGKLVSPTHRPLYPPGNHFY